MNNELLTFYPLVKLKPVDDYGPIEDPNIPFIKLGFYIVYVADGYYIWTILLNIYTTP